MQPRIDVCAIPCNLLIHNLFTEISKIFGFALSLINDPEFNVFWPAGRWLVQTTVHHRRHWHVAKISKRWMVQTCAPLYDPSKLRPDWCPTGRQKRWIQRAFIVFPSPCV